MILRTYVRLTKIRVEEIKKMEISSGLLVILFLVISIQSGVIMALFDSRDYWRKKWKDSIDE